MRKIQSFFFKTYKVTLSPLIKLAFGGSCIYTPTCSEYAYQAVSRYGYLKGGWMSVKRLLRCNSFSAKNTYDPVK